MTDVSLAPWSHGGSRSCCHDRFGLYLLKLGSSLGDWKLLTGLRNLRLWNRLRWGWGIVTVKFVVLGFHVKGTGRFQMTSLKMS